MPATSQLYGGFTLVAGSFDNLPSATCAYSPIPTHPAFRHEWVRCREQWDQKANDHAPWRYLSTYR